MKTQYKTRSRHLLPCLLIFTFLLNHKIEAQTAKADTTFQLNEIVVSANKIKQPLSETARSVSVITRRDIEESPYNNVGDILARQQGLHMVGNAQTPGSLQSIFLRNSNNNQTVVMIDGIRISDPSSVENSTNLAELSLTNVQRIEVVRGSHSTIFGSAAIGGVINIITSEQENSGFNANLSSRAGAFGEGTSTFSQKIFGNYTGENGFYANVSGYWEQTEGIDATIDTVSNPAVFSTSDQDDFDKLDLTGKIGYKNNGWNAFASYRRTDQEVQVDNGSFSDDDNAFAEFDRHFSSYGISRQISPAFELEYRGGFSTLDRLNADDSSRVNEAGDFDGNVSRTSTDGTQLKNELRGTLKRDDFTAIAGLSSSRQTMNIKTLTIARNFNFFQETDLDSLDLSELINSFYVHTQIEGDLISESLSRFSLGVGTRILDHDEFGTRATFEINPKYTFVDNTVLFAAVSTGFNAPSLFQLESPAKGFGEITSLGNKELDPEESISYEVGVRKQFGSRVAVDFSLYRTDVDDAIEFVNLWDANTPVDELSFSDFKGDTYLNATEQQTSGLEFGLEAQITPTLRFNGDITATTSEITFEPENIDQDQTQGNRVQLFETGEFIDSEKEIDGLTRRPSVSGNIGVTYRPLSALKLTVNSQFVGSRDDVFFSSTLGPFGALDREELDSYNVTDVAVGYDINNHFNLKGSITNIFDSEFQEIRGFQSMNRGFYLQVQYSL